MFFKKQKSLVEFYNLDSWINENLTEEEINLLKEKRPDIFEHKLNYNNEISLASHLSNILSYVDTKENASLCAKLVKKIEEEISNQSAESKYYIYMEIMKFYYKNGFIDEAERVINYTFTFSKEALESIKNDKLMSGVIPRNPYYDQLAIIYKKRKEWNKVIEICEKGKAEGWTNDFDKRIEEAKKHL